MVAILVELAEVDDVQHLASMQFKAKSHELAGLSKEMLVNGDQKVFTFKTKAFEGSVGFAVIETTDDDVILSRSVELLTALVDDKNQKGLSVLFLAVVNIVALRSTLILCGPDELSLANAAFPDGVLKEDSNGATSLMDMGSRVSRKLDFIPAVTTAIKGGWGVDNFLVV